MKKETNTLPQSVLSLTAELAPMSVNSKNRVQKKFICTKIFSKAENAALTRMKKLDLLSSELSEDGENGKVLVIHLKKKGVELFRKTLNPETEETQKADEPASVVENVEEVAPEVEPAPEPENVEEAAPEVEPTPEPENEEDAANTPAPQKKKGPKTPMSRETLQKIFALFTPLPEAGTVLQKNYKGVVFCVTLLEGGEIHLQSENLEAKYNSLTAAARAITGQKHISGRKFFGIAGKRLGAECSESVEA